MPVTLAGSGAQGMASSSQHSKTAEANNNNDGSAALLPKLAGVVPANQIGAST